ncbi:hypothetical protein H6A12_03720 [Phocea massiliensis]|uniref:Uncharacterized protein n=1 Tax=Merdimmobilis hominis TaxID=2897707 RepID=A0A938X3R2_9FIRM|nr:hypothetical protein [Merdimmobilis hominis]MBM6920267.1 hypothetical protein [Merdimmobilis hominis]
MAQISIEELYRGEGGGEKYGAGGIMGAVIQDLFSNGIPDGYDGVLWIELLTVTHTLTAAEQIKQEGDFVPGMTDAEPFSLREEKISDDNA